MVWGEIGEDSSNVQAREHMARNLVRYIKEISAKRKQHWSEEEPKLDHARRLRGFFCSGREQLNETFKNARRKLEVHMDSAMPCQCRKTSGKSSLKPPKDPQERTFAMSIGKERWFAITTTRKKTKLFTHAIAKLTS